MYNKKRIHIDILKCKEFNKYIITAKLLPHNGGFSEELETRICYGSAIEAIKKARIFKTELEDSIKETDIFINCGIPVVPIKDDNWNLIDRASKRVKNRFQKLQKDIAFDNVIENSIYELREVLTDSLDLLDSIETKSFSVKRIDA